MMVEWSLLSPGGCGMLIRKTFNNGCCWKSYGECSAIVLILFQNNCYMVRVMVAKGLLSCKMLSGAQGLASHSAALPMYAL